MPDFAAGLGVEGVEAVRPAVDELVADGQGEEARQRGADGGRLPGWPGRRSLTAPREPDASSVVDGLYGPAAGFQQRQVAVGAAGAAGSPRNSGQSDDTAARGGPAGDFLAQVVEGERLSADRQPGGADAAAEDLHGPVFAHGVVGGVEGEGGLEQGERRQFVHVGPLEETAEAVGGLFDVAAVEFGDAHEGEGFGAGVGEEVAAHHALEQQRVGAGLAEGRPGPGRRP